VYSNPRKRGPKKGWAKRLKVQAEAAGLVLQDQTKNGTTEVGTAQIIDWKLIDQYFSHLHPVLPICSNDDICAALRKLREVDPSEAKPLNVARQAFVVGVQACGAFFVQDRARLPRLVNALHECSRGFFDYPCVDAVRAMVFLCWCCHMLSDHSRMTIFCGITVQMTRILGAALPTDLKFCCSFPESWLITSMMCIKPLGNAVEGGSPHARFIEIICHLCSRMSIPCSADNRQEERVLLLCEEAHRIEHSVDLGPMAGIWRLLAQVGSKTLPLRKVSMQHKILTPLLCWSRDTATR
jgi:hypothetical protein